MSYLSCFFGHDIFLSPPHRALIANYQNLGLYDGQSLAILKPQAKIALQKGFHSQQVREQIVEKKNPSIQRDISYYQSAAYIYKNRINRWSSRNSVTIHTAALENHTDNKPNKRQFFPKEMSR
jgi:hypothetical protein